MSPWPKEVLLAKAAAAKKSQGLALTPGCEEHEVPEPGASSSRLAVAARIAMAFERLKAETTETEASVPPPPSGAEAHEELTERKEEEKGQEELTGRKEEEEGQQELTERKEEEQWQKDPPSCGSVVAEEEGKGSKDTPEHHSRVATVGKEKPQQTVAPIAASMMDDEELTEDDEEETERKDPPAPRSVEATVGKEKPQQTVAPIVTSMMDDEDLTENDEEEAARKDPPAPGSVEASCTPTPPSRPPPPHLVAAYAAKQVIAPATANKSVEPPQPPLSAVRTSQVLEEMRARNAHLIAPPSGRPAIGPRPVFRPTVGASIQQPQRLGGITTAAHIPLLRPLRAPAIASRPICLRGLNAPRLAIRSAAAAQQPPAVSAEPPPSTPAGAVLQPPQSLTPPPTSSMAPTSQPPQPSSEHPQPFRTAVGFQQLPSLSALPRVSGPAAVVRPLVPNVGLRPLVYIPVRQGTKMVYAVVPTCVPPVRPLVQTGAPVEQNTNAPVVNANGNLSVSVKLVMAGKSVRLYAGLIDGDDSVFNLIRRALALEISHRVPFDDIVRRGSGSEPVSVIIFVAEDSAEQPKYDEFSKYFQTKSRAGVARLCHPDTALYVLPWSAAQSAGLLDKPLAAGIPDLGSESLVGILAPPPWKTDPASAVSHPRGQMQPAKSEADLKFASKASKVTPTPASAVMEGSASSSSAKPSFDEPLTNVVRDDLTSRIADLFAKVEAGLDSGHDSMAVGTKSSAEPLAKASPEKLRQRSRSRSDDKKRRRHRSTPPRADNTGAEWAAPAATRSLASSCDPRVPLYAPLNGYIGTYPHASYPRCAPPWGGPGWHGPPPPQSYLVGSWPQGPFGHVSAPGVPSTHIPHETQPPLQADLSTTKSAKHGRRRRHTSKKDERRRKRHRKSTVKTEIEVHNLTARLYSLVEGLGQGSPGGSNSADSCSRSLSRSMRPSSRIGLRSRSRSVRVCSLGSSPDPFL